MKLCFVAAILLATLFSSCAAVDRSKFRTCKDTGFCRKYRFDGDTSIRPGYFVDTLSVNEHNEVEGKVMSSADGNINESLVLKVSLVNNGLFRLKITENNKVRWQPLDLLQQSALAPMKVSIVTADSLHIPTQVKQANPGKNFVGILNEEDPSNILIVYFKPLKFEMYHNNILQIVANGRSLMHYDQKLDNLQLSDHHRSESTVDKHNGKEIVDYGEDGLAIYADGTREEKSSNNNNEDNHSKGESFGGHTDSMPHGAMSVGMDFSFPFAQNIYGIPEHTSPLSLPTTSVSSAGLQSYYNQPYRLYNLDVFEYELDNTMALYGNIPFMIGHGISNNVANTAALFWFNPSETFIDVSDGGSNLEPHKESHWISESGEIDFFLISGPSPSSVYKKFTGLVGTQSLPPMFALGYHQCRWNYKDEKDVSNVEYMFEKLDYPMDVIWLDIEHTNGKRYFTWDKLTFPTPLDMQANVTKHGRRMVTIVDPHIKRDDAYHIHKEATSKGLYIKTKDGNDFDGWCWPGSSSYLDFTNSKVRDWWATQFQLDKYVGSTMDLFTWNDMNEPSVFNGPEVSMPKDVVSIEGVEHREWHNLYGIYMQKATADGLVKRSPNYESPSLRQRPFVLTRSFWAGSQKYGAMWTGDNKADWGHLKIASPMLLSINIGGLSFAGADVGGFFGEPSAELFTRWYQAGSFTPFFRGHAHHDTKRREPWAFGDPYTSILRSVAMVRYSLLPYWYTKFYEASVSGLPVMRPMFLEFPADTATFKMDDQWMIGSSLLVKPVTDSNVHSIDVYLPSVSTWYDLNSLQQVAQSGNGLTNVDAPLAKIPVFIQGGHILPRKMRLRRSSKLMFYDPYTLVVAPDARNEASGTIYMDDEISYAHDTNQEYVYRLVEYKSNVLTCSKHPDSADTTYQPMNEVERIEIANIATKPKQIILDNVELVFYYDISSKVLTIKKPSVKVADNWTISILY